MVQLPGIHFYGIFKIYLHHLIRIFQGADNFHTLFQRNIIRINAEIPWSHKLQALLGPPKGEAGKSHHHDALSVFEGIRGNGQKGFSVHQADEIRCGGKESALYCGSQIFILKFYIGGLAFVITDSIQKNLAKIKTGPNLPKHITNLAFKKPEPLGDT